jgi:uncharacterized RDD family membrane protein YckC
MTYAGIGLRAAAAIVDWAVFFTCMWMLALATGNTSDSGFEMQGTPVFLGFLVWFVYCVAAEATHGATIGKALVGLRVVRADGSPAGWQAALVRNVLRVVDGLLVYVVGAILIAASPTKQRLGDRVAGTVVVVHRSVTA